MIKSEIKILLYDIKIAAANICALSTGNIDKHKYLTSEEKNCLLNRIG